MQLNHKHQAVLFDLDGTLVDTAPDIKTAVNNLLFELNRSELDMPDGDFKALVSSGGKQIIKEAIKINENDSQFNKYLARFLELYTLTNHEKTNLFQGIEELLDTLSHHKIIWGIVTNKPTKLTLSLIKNNRYLKKAAVVVCGDTTNFMKPHPAPLYQACKELQIKSQNCIFIGDHIRDILAGNAAGMTTIAALFGYINNKNESLTWPANYFVEKIPELQSLISEIY